VPGPGNWYLNLHQGGMNQILANGVPTLSFRPMLCADLTTFATIGTATPNTSPAATPTTTPSMTMPTAGPSMTTPTATPISTPTPSGSPSTPSAVPTHY
jgi:hypothetical protein